MSSSRKPGYVAAGVLIIVLGLFALWRGVSAAPGELAIRDAKRGNWSRTDAVVGGLGLLGLGIYVIVKFSRQD